MAPAVEEWSLDDVLAMLDGLGLGHLQQPFKENGVNGRLLVTMHEAEFIEVKPPIHLSSLALDVVRESVSAGGEQWQCFEPSR